ncbi:ring-cleaving dioxygenase [Siphonobacter sp. BAB-5405]|uniref:ring-cleaving dioxygenase n=1 Tax=Siphonobacter sp. BAB-5405 TaxID=1864825 RepID=UPI0026D8D534
METNVIGLHHVTAIAGDAKKNYDFYTKVLGMRFVKKTVNFDDPQTYHFYYGNYQAEPGTIWTFFPWGNAVPQGRRGTGQATEVGFSVPEGSLDFWLKRLEQHGVIYNKPATKFGEEYLTVLDPDGLKLELTVTSQKDNRSGNTTAEIGDAQAIKGFSGTTLTLANIQPTAEILTELLDYKLEMEHVNRYRFVNPNSETANVIDLVEVDPVSVAVM